MLPDQPAPADLLTQQQVPPAAKPVQRKNLSRKSQKMRRMMLCSLVTLTKQVTLPNGVHPRVARLTLDERGKLVKLVISR